MIYKSPSLIRWCMTVKPQTLASSKLGTARRCFFLALARLCELFFNQLEKQICRSVVISLEEKLDNREKQFFHPWFSFCRLRQLAVVSNQNRLGCWLVAWLTASDLRYGTNGNGRSEWLPVFYRYWNIYKQFYLLKNIKNVEKKLRHRGHTTCIQTLKKKGRKRLNRYREAAGGPLVYSPYAAADD